MLFAVYRYKCNALIRAYNAIPVIAVFYCHCYIKESVK